MDVLGTAIGVQSTNPQADMTHQTISCRLRPILNRSLHCHRARIHIRSIRICRRTFEVRKLNCNIHAAPNHTAGNAEWNRPRGKAAVTSLYCSRSYADTFSRSGIGALQVWRLNARSSVNC